MKCMGCNVNFINEVSAAPPLSNTEKLALLCICCDSCDGLTAKYFLLFFKLVVTWHGNDMCTTRLHW